MSATVAIILLLLVTCLFLVGLYFFLRPTKLATPTGLQAGLASVVSNGGLKYTFSWTDSNAVGTTYLVKLLNSSNSVITSSSVVTSSTVGKIWSPSTQLVSGSSMVFSVQATGKHSRVSSDVSTLNFVPSSVADPNNGYPPSNGGPSNGGSPNGGSPNNGSPVVPQSELFLVSTTGGYIFKGGNSCSHDSDCTSYSPDLKCSESGKCVYTDDAALSLSNTVCGSLGATTATSDELVTEFNKGASWCSYALVANGDGTVSYEYPSYRPGTGCGLNNRQFPTIPGGASTLNSNILCYGIRPNTGTKVDVFGRQDGMVVTPWSNNLNGGSLWSAYDKIVKPPKYGCSQPGEYCELDPTVKSEAFVITPSTPGVNYILGGTGSSYTSNSSLGQLSCTTDSDCPYDTICNSSSKCATPSVASDNDTFVGIANAICSNVGAVPATDSQVLNDFYTGASWCTNGIALTSGGEVNIGFPSWNTTQGCGVYPNNSPSIVGESPQVPTNIICYGVKPAQGTTVDLFSKGDGLGVVTFDWSDNMQMYSKFDEWNGKNLYIS